MFPTAFHELNHILLLLADRIREVLSGGLVGFYMQGSIAVGDFDEYSDADWIAVIGDELIGSQVDRLQVMHGEIYNSGPEWAKHLEGSYFPIDLFRRADTRNGELWYLDNGASSLIRSDHCNTILVRWIVREKGVRLFGPPPDTLLSPIPAELLREEIRNEILMWGQHILDDPSRYSNCFYQNYIVLNFARMLHDLVRGYPGSKREGARWAKENMDPSWHDLIDATWDGRPDPAVKVRQPADPVAYLRTLDFVRLIMDRTGETAKH